MKPSGQYTRVPAPKGRYFPVQPSSPPPTLDFILYNFKGGLLLKLLPPCTWMPTQDSTDQLLITGGSLVFYAHPPTHTHTCAAIFVRLSEATNHSCSGHSKPLKNVGLALMLGDAWGGGCFGTANWLINSTDMHRNGQGCKRSTSEHAGVVWIIIIGTPVLVDTVPFFVFFLAYTKTREWTRGGNLSWGQRFQFRPSMRS